MKVVPAPGVPDGWSERLPRPADSRVSHCVGSTVMTGMKDKELDTRFAAACSTIVIALLAMAGAGAW